MTSHCKSTVLLACALLTFALAHSSARATSSETTMANEGLRDVPEDAQKVVERLAACTHFSGEISGDGSDRDREVSNKMEELSCNTIEHDAAAIERKYSESDAVRQALHLASQS